MNRVINLCLFAAISAFAIKASYAHTIIIIDKTTPWSPGLSRKFVDGFTAIEESCALAGNVSIFSVGSDAFDARQIVSIDGIPTAKEAPIIAKCEPSSDAYATPTHTTPSNTPNKRTCEEEESAKVISYNEGTRKRRSAITQIVQKVGDFIRSKEEQKNTSISPLIYQISERYCTVEDCDFFIFSNMIEAEVRPFVRKASSPQPTPSPAVVADAKYSKIAVSDVEKFKIRTAKIWGFGADEINAVSADGKSVESIDLEKEAKDNIKIYWREIFKVASSGKAEVSFSVELPPISCN